MEESKKDFDKRIFIAEIEHLLYRFFNKYGDDFFFNETPTFIIYGRRFVLRMEHGDIRNIVELSISEPNSETDMGSISQEIDIW